MGRLRIKEFLQKDFIYFLFSPIIYSFTIALKFAQRENTKEKVRNKLKHILGRAEKLKEYLRMKEEMEENRRKQKEKGAGSKNHLDKQQEELNNRINEAIQQEIPNVSFDDVIGLDVAKQYLVEAAILPKKFPQLFQNRKS